MTAFMEMIRDFAQRAEKVLPHRFELIEKLDDGTSMPGEALSEDHTLGLYCEQIPRKMIDVVEAFVPVGWEDFEVQSDADGNTFLEYPPLRDVVFRAEQLQYLSEDWWATTPCVRYPEATARALAGLMEEMYGDVHLYIHPGMPMPLWIRARLKEDPDEGVQAVIQARGPDRVLPCNIHTEVPMEYARRWEEQARSYYRLWERQD